MPRNGFLPPIHEVVLIMNDFVPLNEVTGKSIDRRKIEENVFNA